VRATFAGELAGIETRVHDELRRAVLALSIVTDAVRGPMSVWSSAIRDRSRELDAASATLEADLVGVTARQAPVAGDLRLVLALIQIAQHVGLIANQFELIAQQLDAVGSEPGEDYDTGERLALMAKLAAEQLHRSLRAFVTRDVHVARAIDHDDDAIDRLNRAVFESILRLEMPLPERELALRQVLIARSLERIGDNAVDIAEQVIFLVTAQMRELTDASHPKPRN
jgi:phosphate transport system protein